MPPKKVVCRQFEKKDGEKYTFCFKPKGASKEEKATPKNPEKKKYKFVAKPKAKPAPKLTELERVTGKTKEELNKLDPLELFGMLPTVAKKTVLDPKKTGVKVARHQASVKSLLQLAENYRKKKHKTSNGLSQREIDIFGKYEKQFRFGMPNDEFDEKNLEFNKELGEKAGNDFYSRITGEKYFKTTSPMKNIKKYLDLLLGRNIGKYSFGSGNAYALMEKLKALAMFINKPTTSGQKIMRENYLQAKKDFN